MQKAAMQVVVRSSMIKALLNGLLNWDCLFRKTANRMKREEEVLQSKRKIYELALSPLALDSVDNDNIPSKDKKNWLSCCWKQLEESS